MIRKIICMLLALCVTLLGMTEAAALGIEATPYSQDELSAASYIYGDVDSNGKVSTDDALSVLKASVGISKLTGKGFVKGDVNYDNKLTTDDALYILKKAVGIIRKTPVENLSASAMNKRIKEYVSSEKTEMIRLVNPYNVLPSTWNPSVKALKTKTSKKFHTMAADKLDDMINACNKKYGSGKLWAQSTYRDYATQKALYEKEVQRWKNKGYSDSKARAKAATIVAAPGTSEHNTGLACDFNNVEESFSKTKMYPWLLENAQSYGFVERYPKGKGDITGIIWEPWHFRYVGVDAAKEMNSYGWCLEEYHYYNHL